MKGFIKHNVQLNVRCAAISILMIPIKNGNFVIFSIYPASLLVVIKTKFLIDRPKVMERLFYPMNSLTPYLV